MINRDCKCGGHISSYINFTDLAECCDCHKCYVLKEKQWNNVSKGEFNNLYREKLVEQQRSNK